MNRLVICILLLLSVPTHAQVKIRGKVKVEKQIKAKVRTGVAGYGIATSSAMYKVPAGVTKLRITMWGAGGGGGSASRNGLGGSDGRSGGSGAYVVCDVNVTPLELLDVRVGGGGQGANKGGNSTAGHAAGGRGGGGGGYSGVFRGTTPLAVAGAGGGGAGGGKNNGGDGGRGGGGGLNGITGDEGWPDATEVDPGQGATQSAGGAGGTGTYANGQSGSYLLGGHAPDNQHANSIQLSWAGKGGINGGGDGGNTYDGNDGGSGGGGAGYYGGGGGGASLADATLSSGAGGGGGSSYCSGTTIDIQSNVNSDPFVANPPYNSASAYRTSYNTTAGNGGAPGRVACCTNPAASGAKGGDGLVVLEVAP